MTFEWKLNLVLKDDSVRCDAERGCRVLSVQKQQQQRQKQNRKHVLVDVIPRIPAVLQNCSRLLTATLVCRCRMLNVGRREEQHMTKLCSGVSERPVVVDPSLDMPRFTHQQC